MFSARQFAHAATASLLIAGGFVVSFLSAVHARAAGLSSICQDATRVAVLPAPIAPWKGAPLRVLFASDKPLEGGTVARKRFWRGNFLFAQYPGLESSGFKRFRPIVREKNGTLRR